MRILKPDGRFGRYNSLRLPGHDYSNTSDEYFITLTTLGRTPYFADVILARETASLLLDLHFDGIVRLFAFCLMPDHLHALLRLARSGWTLDGALSLFKSKSTRIYWKRARTIAFENKTAFFGSVGAYDLISAHPFRLLPEHVCVRHLSPCSPRAFQSKRLWQVSFYDHISRNEHDFTATVEYILQNPVRRGLVSEPWMYPFSGSL